MVDTLLCWPILYWILTTSPSKLLFCIILWEGLLELCLLWLIIILVQWCIIGWIQWQIRFLTLLESTILKKVLRRLLNILTNCKIKWSKFNTKLKWIKICWTKLPIYSSKRHNCKNLFWKKVFSKILKMLINKQKQKVRLQLNRKLKMKRKNQRI